MTMGVGLRGGGTEATSAVQYRIMYSAYRIQKAASALPSCTSVVSKLSEVDNVQHVMKEALHCCSGARQLLES